jgi:AraC family transcriptional regulator
LLPDYPSDPVRKALRLKAEQGVCGSASVRLIAEGPTWRVEDVICSSGPKDRPFEERHTWVSVAVVLSGSFSYGNELGRNLLTPGSLLLGTAGGCFTCGHEHGEGDRCLAFHFEPSWFEEIAAAAGARRMEFALNSLPALRSLAPLVARSVVAAQGHGGAAVPAPAGRVRRPDELLPTSFEELALEVAGTALNESATYRPQSISRSDERRVGAIVRYMEERFAEPCALSDLARLAGLSPFHFLRVFRGTTGVTPHQHLLRTRLRAAAIKLAGSGEPVTGIALAIGFEDLSNFTRTFRAEYRLSPSQYRAQFHRPAVKAKGAPGRGAPADAITSRRTVR